MANHSKTKLPWPIDIGAMALLAKQSVQAAFGGLYLCGFEPAKANRKDNEGRFYFEFEIPGYARGNGPQAWSEGKRHVEHRHSSRGIDRLCQILIHQQLACCFGARSINDEGLGPISPGEPGLLRLFETRSCFGGRVDSFFGIPNPDAPKNPKNNEAGDWLLFGPALAKARKACPKLFEFKAPTDVPLEYQEYRIGSIPENMRPKMIAHHEADTMDFRTCMSWSQAIDSDFPGKLRAEQAGSFLLPAAAMGLGFPERLVKDAGIDWCARALALAIVHREHFSSEKIVDLARQFHGPKADGLCQKAMLESKNIEKQKRPEDPPLKHWDILESISAFEQRQIQLAAPEPNNKAKSKAPRV